MIKTAEYPFVKPFWGKPSQHLSKLSHILEFLTTLFYRFGSFSVPRGIVIISGEDQCPLWWESIRGCQKIPDARLSWNSVILSTKCFSNDFNRNWIFKKKEDRTVVGIFAFSNVFFCVEHKYYLRWTWILWISLLWESKNKKQKRKHQKICENLATMVDQQQGIASSSLKICRTADDNGFTLTLGSNN